ncbi:hypothetical protein FF1_041695 [Malus domestica]
MASKKGQAVLETIDATSIEEQLAQMSEAITRLTKNADEKNLQIAALANQLEAHRDVKVDPKADPLEREADKEDEPLVEKVEEKHEPNQVASLT